MTLFIRDLDLPAEQVPGWVQAVRTDFYFELFVAAAVFYDTIITMDMEVRYFWDLKISLTKFVYFLNFYRTPPYLCVSSMWISYFSYATSVIAIDYVLTLRVLALFQNDKTMTIGLSALLFLEASAKLVFVVLITRLQPAVIVRLAGDLTNCGYNNTVPYYSYIIDWSIPLAYGTLLLCLAVYKGRQFWKVNGYDGSRLVSVLVRDQVLYYILIISCSVMNILTIELSSNSVVFSVLGSLGKPTFLCILGSRMFFNVKEAAEHGVNVGTNWSSYSHSAIRFEDAPNGQWGEETGGLVLEKLGTED